MAYRMLDKIYFMGPMSLGDNFVISGAVHHFADRCYELHLPIVPTWKKTLTTLYQDYSNIIIAPITSVPEHENEYIRQNKLSRINRIPVYAQRDNAGVFVPALWDIQLYHFLELPYSIRYNNFKLPENLDSSRMLYEELVKNEEYYILISTGTGKNPQGTDLTNLEGIRKLYQLPSDVKYICVDWLSQNMMDYIHLIQNASEIHCVPSSFYCLVENIHKMTKAKLFFHSNRKNTFMNVSSDWNNHRWVVIEYDNKL